MCRRAETLRIVQAEKWEEKRWLLHDFVNRWDLRLGDGKPFRLRIKTGVTRGEWDLGRLPITDLRVETGVSENRIMFSGPNPETMMNFRLGSGVGDVDIEGLLDANFSRAEVSGGVGDVTLRFNGEKLVWDATVKMEGGVGSFTIIVDEDVPARATVRGLTSVSLTAVSVGGVDRYSAANTQTGPTRRRKGPSWSSILPWVSAASHWIPVKSNFFLK